MVVMEPLKCVSNWLDAFNSALCNNEIEIVTTLFVENCFWRDLLVFTWNIKTLEGPRAIAEMLHARLQMVKPYNWNVIEAKETNRITEAWITFETTIARCEGFLRLQENKCWTLLTAMQELKGFEEKKGPTREMGIASHPRKFCKSSQQQKMQQEAKFDDYEKIYCLIIGGGQGGITLGARLKRLGVPTVIIEKNERPGDSWRKRYQSLTLHDTVWYDHLPYLAFPEHWPVYSPKDKIADWLEMYTQIMELNYWVKSECKRAEYNETKKTWTVQIDREGKQVVLHPKHLIFATGLSGLPNLPQFPGSDAFEGTQCHSSAYTTGALYAKKNCIVIGSNNSAHDIASDLWQHDANVTMIQRSSTLVVNADSLRNLSGGVLYSEQALQAGITTHKADTILASIPYKIMPDFNRPIAEKIAARDASFYEKLKTAGFLYDWGDDASGLYLKYVRRASGYHINFGISELIIDGKIKLKSGVTVARINKHSVSFSDQSELPADLIVYATGFNSMNGWIEQLISKEVAVKVGECWGLGSNTTKDPGPWEGELRNMWKPTRQENLWFQGGNLQQARYYSHYLALQLKARMEGLSTSVYGMDDGIH